MEADKVILKDVEKSYAMGVKALDGITLEIPDGQWLAVMGPSGSGKTTMLNLLDGLDKPSRGLVLVFGTDVAGLRPDESAVFRREHLGLVFQQYHLMPYLTAVENVMLAQYYHSMVDRSQALEALDNVGMAGRAHHLPSQLSGGEQQRVCIARALINDPRLVLADEPTGNLDEGNEEKVLEVFRELHKAGRTVIMVTHDRRVAETAERIVELQHGRLVQHHARVDTSRMAES